MKWSAYAAECIDCIVRPCVQNPWYCLHSPINVFCMVWSCCHGDPRIGRLKKRRCLHGRSERERERSTACMSVDWRTDTRAWHSVCSRLLICSDWYYWTCCLVMSCCCLFCPFCIIMCNVVCPSWQLSCHLLQFCTCCTEWKSCSCGHACTCPSVELYVLCRFVGEASVILTWTQDGERAITSPVPESN